MVSGSLSLPSRGSFHLSLTVLFSIGHQVVFSLGGWSPRLPTGFLVSCGTLDTRHVNPISLTGLLPSLVPLSSDVQLQDLSIMQVRTPIVRRPSVWALPISLAATLGIDVSFSSSGYLDVSVHRVRFPYLCIQYGIPQRGGFPHSDIGGSKLHCQLPPAFRRLARPSSPVIAKASTTCT